MDWEGKASCLLGGTEVLRGAGHPSDPWSCHRHHAPHRIICVRHIGSHLPCLYPVLAPRCPSPDLFDPGRPVPADNPVIIFFSGPLCVQEVPTYTTCTTTY